MNAVIGQHGQSRGDGNALQFCVVETFGLGDLVYLTAFLYGLRDAVPGARIRVVTGPTGSAFAFPEDLAVEVVGADWPWDNVYWWQYPLRSLRAILRARRQLVPLSGPWVGLDPRGDVRHKYVLRLLKVRDVIRDGTKGQGLGRLLGQTNRHVLESRQAYLETTCRKLGIDKRVTLRWPWADGTGAPGGNSRRLSSRLSRIQRSWGHSLRRAPASGARITRRLFPPGAPVPSAHGQRRVTRLSMPSFRHVVSRYA